MCVIIILSIENVGHFVWNTASQVEV